MKRLTTNKSVSEMSMIELAHNSCYAKDRWAKYRDYETDIDARELAGRLLKEHAGWGDDFTCGEDFEDCMADFLQSGLDDIEGLIAVFYRNIWAMADLRERLKYYEDLEEQGKLLELPCAVGDTVYQHMIVGADKDKSKAVYEVFEAKVFKFSLDSYTLCFWTETADDKKYQNELPLSAFGKTVFLTKKEAEAAMERMGDVDGE